LKDRIEYQKQIKSIIAKERPEEVDRLKLAYNYLKNNKHSANDFTRQEFDEAQQAALQRRLSVGAGAHPWHPD
jgi:hypothetical protein